MDALLHMGGSGWNRQCAYESHTTSLVHSYLNRLGLLQILCLLSFAFFSPRWRASESLGICCVGSSLPRSPHRCSLHSHMTMVKPYGQGRCFPTMLPASFQTLASTFHKTHVSNSHSPVARVGILSLHSGSPVSPTHEAPLCYAVAHAARTGEPHIPSARLFQVVG